MLWRCLFSDRSDIWTVKNMLWQLPKMGLNCWDLKVLVGLLTGRITFNRNWLIDWLIHSFIHSFIHSYFNCLIGWLVLGLLLFILYISELRSLVCWLVDSFIHWLIHSLIDYVPTRDGRLSWPRWPVTYQNGLPAHGQLPIQILTRLLFRAMKQTLSVIGCCCCRCLIWFIGTVDWNSRSSARPTRTLWCIAVGHSSQSNDQHSARFMMSFRWATFTRTFSQRRTGLLIAKCRHVFSYVQTLAKNPSLATF